MHAKTKACRKSQRQERERRGKNDVKSKKCLNRVIDSVSDWISASCQSNRTTSGSKTDKQMGAGEEWDSKRNRQTDGCG